MGIFLQIVLGMLLSITAIFLILLVLIQRGRGGGLAGAFGGAGGQSAFGTKAGDLFTRITIGAAAFWLVLCAVSDKLLSSSVSSLTPGLGKQVTAPVLPPGGAPGADRGAPPTGTPPTGAMPLEQGEAGPTTVSPDATAPPAANKPVEDAASQSLPPGSIGPNGALLPQQPLTPPAATSPATTASPATTTSPATTAETATASPPPAEGGSAKPAESK